MSQQWNIATFNKTLLNNPGQCTLQTCPLQIDGHVLANTTYIPTLAGNALYTAIFALLLLAQIGLGFWYRTWGYLYGMLGGGILEVIGYGARIGMRSEMFTQNFFIMYLVCLTIGPAFLSASIYLCLSRLIVIYSTDCARFRPQTYTYFFIGCDVISLVLQAAGGAVASIETAGSSGQWAGIWTMVAGVAFQVASLLVYSALCAEFYLNVRKARIAAEKEEPFNPHFASLRSKPMFQFFPIALTLAVLFIFIRSVFRCVELSGGFNGKLANQQITFMILEGAMVIIAVTILTVYHPGLVIGAVAWKEASWSHGTHPEKPAGRRINWFLWSKKN